jgi:pimeloyl-ACP methyl ester carboxylesterase
MTRESVVYVHGLWATPAQALLLRRRLSREFAVETFRYATAASSMTDVADRLAEFVAALAPRTLHLVGHSLGGLVIYRYLERHPDQPPGKVVFLGVPIVGSRFAQGVGRWSWGAAVLGRCVTEELLVQRERRWTAPRPLGIIAGTRPLGLAPLLARSSGAQDASDGTVAVSETRLHGAADHITVAVSHMGLLMSARVAEETRLFLRDGHFALSRRSSSRSSSARSA